MMRRSPEERQAKATLDGRGLYARPVRIEREDNPHEIEARRAGAAAGV